MDAIRSPRQVPGVSASVAPQNDTEVQCDVEVLAGSIRYFLRRFYARDVLDRPANFIGNLIRLPVHNFWIGMEFQWGERRDLDGQNAHAKRILWGVHYAY